MEKGFMLDTNVLIHLVGTSEDLHWFKEGLNIGHSYFITPVQENECSGMTYRVPGRLVVKQVSESELTRIGEIRKELNIQVISSIATWNKGVQGNGIERLMSTDGAPFIRKLTADDLIAEAMTYHGLILITNDCSTKKSKRLYQRINEKYPGRAMTRNEYIDRVRKITNSME